MQVAVDISPGAYIIIIMLFTGEIIFETDKSENKKLCIASVKPSPSALRPCLTLRVHTYLIFICVIIISVYYNYCCTTLVPRYTVMAASHQLLLYVNGATLYHIHRRRHRSRYYSSLNRRHDRLSIVYYILIIVRHTVMFMSPPPAVMRGAIQVRTRRRLGCYRYYMYTADLQ